MNPTLHLPLELTIEPTIVGSSRPVPDALCNLKMRYRPEGNWQVYMSVWIPKELQSVLNAGEVRSVHLETLEDNGAATRALGYPADFLILGVEKRTGEKVEWVPPEMRSFKRDSFIGGGLLCALGAVGLTQGWAWLGALALVAGTHAIRAAQRIPTKPFWVLTHRF